MAISVTSIIVGYMAVIDTLSPPLYTYSAVSRFLSWMYLALWLGGAIACFIYSLLMARLAKNFREDSLRDRLNQAGSRPYFQELPPKILIHHTYNLEDFRRVLILFLYVAVIGVVCNTVLSLGRGI